MTKRVVIVAMGGSLFEYIQLRQKAKLPSVVDGEVWGVNLTGAFMRVDRVIHMDPFDEDMVGVYGPDTVRQFASLTVPIYMAETSPLLPTSIAYPIHEVIGTIGLPYINTTVSYAICLAIHERFEEISLFGCDFTYPDRHAAESGRACAEFWLRFAMDRGISVKGAFSTTLFDMNEKQVLYGYRQTYRELAEKCTQPAPSGSV